MRLRLRLSIGDWQGRRGKGKGKRRAVRAGSSTLETTCSWLTSAVLFISMMGHCVSPDIFNEEDWWYDSTRSRSANA
jgi:hypothetical protein